MVRITLSIFFVLNFMVSGAFASDDLPAPLIIAYMSQNETARDAGEELPCNPFQLVEGGVLCQLRGRVTKTDFHEFVTIEVNDIVSNLEVPDESTIDPRSRYLRILEKLRDRAPDQVRRIFTRIKVPSEFQEFIIADLNEKLTNAPELIVTSNASGFGIRPTVYAGLGMSDYVLNQLRKKSWGRHLPSFAHLGIGFGVGLGVMTYTHEDKRHLILRVDLNAEHTASMINWMIEAFAGVAVQKTSQKLSPQFLEQKKNLQVLINRFERSNLGPAGTMISQDGYFEHALPLGMSVPPLIGPTSFYKFRIYQLQLNFKFNIEGLLHLKDRVVRACRISVKGS